MYSVYDNPQLDAEYTQVEYQSFTAPVVNVTNIEGGTVITTINGGGGGQTTGSTITISGGTTGLNFNAVGNTLTMNGTLVVANGGTSASTAAGARANLGAAQSGTNSDISILNALAGTTGWSLWTGGSDKTSHSTFSGTASVAYSQAEMQAVMDSLKQVTEGFMALLTTLFGWGGIKN